METKKREGTSDRSPGRSRSKFRRPDASPSEQDSSSGHSRLPGTAPEEGAAPLRVRRLGRRRQVDADRPPAARHARHLRRPALGGETRLQARAARELDLSLLTDGLKAEREQGITIDVAYRYFSTAKRKFIIADTPGHVQYTRNMATGASTANVAVILIDARLGVLHAVAPARVHRVAARHSAPRRVRQQDGPRRLRRGTLRRAFSAAFQRVRGRPRLSGRHVHSHQRARRRQLRAHEREHALVQRARRCSSTSRSSRSRARINYDEFPLPGAVRAAPGPRLSRLFAASIASGVVRKGDRVMVLPATDAVAQSRRSTRSRATLDAGLRTA